LNRRFDYRDKKRTVKELIEWLKQFPEDAHVYAYSGECTGVCVVEEQPDLDGKFQELGWLETIEPWSEYT